MQAQKSIKLSCAAVISFFISLVLCFSLIIATITSRVNMDKMRIEQLMDEQFSNINERIYKLFNKTESLVALVLQSNGNIENFNLAATYIADDDAILNVLVAPDGIVAQVYPLSGNEAVIGLDFFAESAGNKEAAAARDTGELVMGGPFDLVQGGQALVGRKPVYIDGEFWGIVSVTLKFPKIIQDIAEADFAYRGLNYEWWRISPDTGERQIIAGGVESNARFLEKRFEFLNAEWYLKVAPFHAWYSYAENILTILSGLLVSILMFFIMQRNYELKRLRNIFETMAKTDSLTGIYNRRYFLEMAQINLERSRRLGTECFIMLFDLDRFKSVNDTHGHTMGDFVLTETASRIKALIRPYDLFARYGGEEFIIFAADIDKKNAAEMAERLRLSICEEKFEYKDIAVNSSASFGVALVNFGHDLKEAIKYADKALYKAKNEGRNRVAIYQREEYEHEK